jgi:hypothetical protein
MILLVFERVKPIEPAFYIGQVTCVNDKLSLAPLTFRQVSVGPIEFQALPGPEVRLRRTPKIMRHASVLGPGGQAVLSPRTGLFRCRGARSIRLDCELGARWARPILRKHGRTSDWISFPADAFCAQRPSFRAPSLLMSRKRNHQSEGKQAFFFPPPQNRPKNRMILFAYIQMERIPGEARGPYSYFLRGSKKSIAKNPLMAPARKE